MNDGKRVLLFDDDEVVQQLLVKLCARLGVQMDVAGGEDAVEKALVGAAEYDMFFVDLIMPGISGWEIVRKIKAAGCADKPIVILTGAVLSEEEKEKVLADLAAIIEKETFSVSAFNELLGRYLFTGNTA